MQNDAIHSHRLQTIKQVPHIEGDLNRITAQLSSERLRTATHILCVGTDQHNAVVGLAAEFDDVVVLIGEHGDPFQTATSARRSIARLRLKPSGISWR